MTTFSRLDLIFWSCGAGWSESVLSVDEHRLAFTMTHVFSNPMAEITRATRELIEGRPTTAFTWLDEPGTMVFDLERPSQAPTLRGLCRVFRELHVNGVPYRAKPELELEFTTHLTYWAALVHASLSRTSMLSRHSLYSSWNDAAIDAGDLNLLRNFLKNEGPRRRRDEDDD